MEGTFCIVTGSHAEAVHEAVGEEATVVAVEPGGAGEALAAAGRAPLRALVIDADAGPGLAAAVLRLRMARPEARVIALAEGREPGDAEIARLAGQAGVWDIVTEAEALAEALERPGATIADAARWLDPAVASEAPEARPRERVVERVVREPLPTRPLEIAVVGAVDGAGCSTVARRVAEALEGAGWPAALVEGEDAVPVGTHGYAVRDCGAAARLEQAAWGRVQHADRVLWVWPPLHRLRYALGPPQGSGAVSVALGTQVDAERTALRVSVPAIFAIPDSGGAALRAAVWPALGSIAPTARANWPLRLARAERAVGHGLILGGMVTVLAGMLVWRAFRAAAPWVVGVAVLVWAVAVAGRVIAPETAAWAVHALRPEWLRIARFGGFGGGIGA